MKPISEMTLVELRKYASELGLEKISSMKKDALLELVAGKETGKPAKATEAEKKPARAVKKADKAESAATNSTESEGLALEAKPAQRTTNSKAKASGGKAENTKAKSTSGKAGNTKAKSTSGKAGNAKENTTPDNTENTMAKATTDGSKNAKADALSDTAVNAKADAPSDSAKKTKAGTHSNNTKETKSAAPVKNHAAKQSARERLEQFALKRAQIPVQNQPAQTQLRQQSGDQLSTDQNQSAQTRLRQQSSDQLSTDQSQSAQNQGQQANNQPVNDQGRQQGRIQRRQQSSDQKPNAQNQRANVQNQQGTQNQRQAVNRQQTDSARQQQGSRTSGQPGDAQRLTQDAQAFGANSSNIPVQPIDGTISPEMQAFDSGVTKQGILEVMPDGFAFIRCDNFLPGENDVYVSPAQVRRFNIKTGDIIEGNMKIKAPNEKFSALLYIKSINGMPPAEALTRAKFEDLTPIFPNERIHLETPGCGPAMRMVDLLSPIGKGQRGMIVSQPKAGKTTLLKQIARAITTNHPDMHLIVLLIDERPEEVTDMKESISGPNVEVIYSTFDELPEKHKRVSEMVIERAKRLVEHRKDVVILLDSITRLARAYNLTCQSSGRTLSGGLDPAALYMPKRFFGAARNMKEGGSLTILATALVDTGSRMDDVVFEEFKGTGNMELVLDRNLSERRIFPAIDLPRSGTRRDDLLLNPTEQEANYIMRRAFSGSKGDEAVERIINMFAQTRKNTEFCEIVKKLRPMPGPAQTKQQQ